MFNCGLVLFKLLLRTYPMSSKRVVCDDIIYKSILKYGFKRFWDNFERCPKISDNAKRLIMGMIHPDINKRMTFKEI